jgi:phage baseplate assembly protein W
MRAIGAMICKKLFGSSLNSLIKVPFEKTCIWRIINNLEMLSYEEFGQCSFF